MTATREFAMLIETLLRADEMAFKARRKRPPTLETVKTGYKSAIRSTIRGYWNGTFDEAQFFDNMLEIIETGFTAAWKVAARSCSIADGEWTPEEQRALRKEIIAEQAHVENLAVYIEERNKANRGRLKDALKNVHLWVQRLQSVHDKAKTMTCGDKKLKWVRHAEDSCASCRALDGKVYRSSVWEKNGLYPNCEKLECVQDAGGVPVCRCELRETDEPGSRGRPPLYNVRPHVVKFVKN